MIEVKVNMPMIAHGSSMGSTSTITCVHCNMERDITSPPRLSKSMADYPASGFGYVTYYSRLMTYSFASMAEMTCLVIDADTGSVLHNCNAEIAWACNTCRTRIPVVGQSMNVVTNFLERCAETHGAWRCDAVGCNGTYFTLMTEPHPLDPATCRV